jgi:hypothetical protein
MKKKLAAVTAVGMAILGVSASTAGADTSLLCAHLTKPIATVDSQSLPQVTVLNQCGVIPN